jgi:hypothetical protein
MELFVSCNCSLSDEVKLGLILLLLIITATFTSAIPHCLGSRLSDGDKVSLTHRPCSSPRKHFYFSLWYSFPLQAE